MKPIHLVSYSETHEPLFRKHFLPSYNDFGLHRSFYLQETRIEAPGGDFGSAEFNSMGVKLMTQVRHFIAAHMGRTILCTGVDMRFYHDISEEVLFAVENHEIVSINDNYGLWCGCFMAFKVTDRIISLFDWCIKNDHLFANAEFTMNHGAKEIGIGVHMMPDDYFTVGLNNGGIAWNPGDSVNPPRGMRLHHANFTIGAENKMKLLDAVLSAHQSLS